MPQIIGMIDCEKGGVLFHQMVEFVLEQDHICTITIIDIFMPLAL
ncbi:MAG: hypothetical protein SVO26_00140 [Chloroflexota bacterium]|nr:hypothetical protein [Chloroflexota bacterium]